MQANKIEKSLEKFDTELFSYMEANPEPSFETQPEGPLKAFGKNCRKEKSELLRKLTPVVRAIRTKKTEDILNAIEEVKSASRDLADCYGDVDEKKRGKCGRCAGAILGVVDLAQEIAERVIQAKKDNEKIDENDIVPWCLQLPILILDIKSSCGSSKKDNK